MSDKSHHESVEPPDETTCRACGEGPRIAHHDPTGQWLCTGCGSIVLPPVSEREFWDVIFPLSDANAIPAFGHLLLGGIMSIIFVAAAGVMALLTAHAFEMVTEGLVWMVWLTAGLLVLFGVYTALLSIRCYYYAKRLPGKRALLESPDQYYRRIQTGESNDG